MCAARPAAGHPGEVRRHPPDQLRGGVSGRGHGGGRLPELHHLRGDVLRRSGPEARLHLPRLHGQEPGLPG